MSITFSRAQVSNAFTLADANGDGKLSKAEVKAAYSQASEGTSDSDKQTASLLEALGKLGKLMAAIDGESGVSKEDIRTVMGMDGDDKDFSEADASRLVQNPPPSPEQQLARQRAAARNYENQSRQPWISPGTAYSPNGGGTHLPPSLQGNLSNANFIAQEAMQFAEFMGQYQGINGQAGGMMYEMTGVNIASAGQWSPMMQGLENIEPESPEAQAAQEALANMSDDDG